MPKKEPWRASSMLVRANIEHMHPDARKHLEKYAMKKGITLEESTKRAVEIIRKLEYHTIQKVAKGEIAPVITLLYAKSPARHTLRLVNEQFRDGNFPESEEDVLKRINPTGKEVLKQNKKMYATEEKEKASRGLVLGGLATSETRTTAYSKDVFNDVVTEIMEGKTPNKARVGVIVHETLETLNLLPGRVHEGLGFTEMQLTDSLMRDIHNLFSEYGVPRVRKK